MRLHSLPILREDETLYSLAARARLANAAKDDRDACRSMFGYSKNTRVSDYPVNVIHFCEMTKGYFGDPSTILTRMTLVRFYEQIGIHPWHKGSSSRPAEIAGYGLSTLSNGNLRTWKFCKDCVMSDLKAFPITYWRRSHQLPTSFFCPTHGTALSCSLAHPHIRHNRFMFPDDDFASCEQYCSVGTPENDLVQRQLTQLGIAILFHCETSLNPNPATAKILHATTIRALNERGLITPKGAMRLPEFTSELSARYKFLRWHPEFSDALSEKGLNALGRNLINAGTWRSVVHQLLLIEWLFGSWTSFHKQCVWQHTMDHENYICATPAKTMELFDESESLHSQRPMHRAACIDFLGTELLPKRSIFARAAPRSFRWLLRYDKHWFDLHCPVFQRKQMQKELF